MDDNLYYRASRPTGMYRSRDGMFLGVCAGIAEYFGWRPWVLRIIVIVLTITTAHFFFWIYLLLGLLMKKR